MFELRNNRAHDSEGDSGDFSEVERLCGSKKNLVAPDVSIKLSDIAEKKTEGHA